MSNIFDIFNNNAQTQAAGAQIAGIQAGVNQALPYYNTGLTALQSGLPAWAQNLQATQKGQTAYGNAVGANGPQGNAAALAGFQNNPGYQFQLQQGDNALTAQNAATGGTGSGNEALALSKFNQGLAGTSWNNYVSSLAPYIGASTANAAGQTGALSGINSANQNIGNMMYGANTSIGNANANAALGNLSGSANMWGLGSNLAGGLLGFLSDEKVKEDIEPVGKMADGQTIYKYRYAGDPRHQIGLIAQEVEKAVPDAVFEVLPDLRAVDYDRATERAASILKFTRNRFDPPPTVHPYAEQLMELAA